MGIEEEEDKFEQWLFAMDRKYDGREPEFIEVKPEKKSIACGKNTTTMNR